VHDSLNSPTMAEICEPVATDQAFFEKAMERLPKVAQFPMGTVVDNPFIQIPFDPQPNGQFGVGASSGQTNVLSLRRRFAFNEDRTLLLMTRAIESRRNGGCWNVGNTNDGVMDGGWSSWGGDHRMYYSSCAGIVFNSEGSGICIRWTGSQLTFPYWSLQEYNIDGWDSWLDMYGYNHVDHFMWRKLMKTANRFSSSYVGANTWFSPKCYGSPTCDGGDGHTLVLPDHDHFGL